MTTMRHELNCASGWPDSLGTSLLAYPVINSTHCESVVLIMSFWSTSHQQLSENEASICTLIYRYTSYFAVQESESRRSFLPSCVLVLMVI